MNHRLRCIAVPGGSPSALLDALVPTGLEGSHRYEPHGESLYRLGDELCAIIHTWPEFEVATVDIHSLQPFDPSPVLAEQGWTLKHLESMEAQWNGSVT